MNLLRWHLWREWREHRLALLMVFLVLPLVALGISRVPPKAVVGDPVAQSGAALAFVVVLLVGVGGELLGGDRRGPVLQWLERVPSGLRTAFLAKLLFLAATVTLAAVYGLGVARTIAHLRGVAPGEIRWEPFSFLIGLSLVAWTFACSAWALRGGVAIFAAVLVLVVVGYPAWEVLHAGYGPGAIELWTAGALLVLAGLLSAGLGFLVGGKLGRGTVMATCLGLAPALPLLAVSTGWSIERFRWRERLDPLADDFGVHHVLLSEDARHAFLLASHWDDPQWSEMPIHVLDVDLEDGSWNRIGHYVDHEVTSAENERGLYRPDQLVVWTEEREKAFVFDLSDGALASIRESGKASWRPMGLGQCVQPSPHEAERIRDPFRGRDYPVNEIPFWASPDETDLLVRPGRWLCRESWDSPWFLYDPDTQDREPLDMDAYTALLALLSDGSVLLDPIEGPVLSLNPETASAEPIEGSEGLQLAPNHLYFREPGMRRDDFYPVDGPVAVSTGIWPAMAWYALDREHMRFHFVPAKEGYHESYLRGLPDGRAILLSNEDELIAVDLETGARTVLFPRARAD